MTTLDSNTTREMELSTAVPNHVISIEEEQEEEDEGYSWAVPLIQDMARADWNGFLEQLGTNPTRRITTRINARQETFLHHAVDTGNLFFVEELVSLMNPADLELPNIGKDHALISAATGGDTRMAEAMLNKNPDLTGIPSQHGWLPVIIAVRNGNSDMADYLYDKTTEEQLNLERPENDAHIFPAGTNGARLLIAAIVSDMYGLALKLLQEYPALAITCDNHRRNAATILAKRPSAFPSGQRHGLFEGFIHKVVSILRVEEDVRTDVDGHSSSGMRYHIWNLIKRISVPGLRIKEMHEKQMIHSQILQILEFITDALSRLDQSQLREARGYIAMINASQFGIIEMVGKLIACNPELQFSFDGEARDVFHTAVLHRREHVFNLIYKMGNKNMITVRADTSHNTLLHAAGCAIPSSQLNRISGAALQLQNELQWFKEVERIVAPRFKEEINLNRKTAREIFTENHKEMQKEGEKWMKETAGSCMVVATLIAAVMFTAAFTVPGGNDGQTGNPVLIKKESFMIFVVTDALSLFSSLTSLLMFLAILTSRYAEEDFLFLLPRKMILGLTTLFFSIVFMLASFSTTLFIILEQKDIWIAIFSTVIACFPVALFVRLQFPLLVDMVSPTLGPSIFAKTYKGIHIAAPQAMINGDGPLPIATDEARDSAWDPSLPS